ncbi:MAG: ABC transporter substrate-binding protein [Anaerolineales bacterium]|jgi:ABC-type nitrate/sulfonate/bicarbonate transport system substrate-binding protein
MKPYAVPILCMAIAIGLTACGPSEPGQEVADLAPGGEEGLAEVTLMLDWVPNTNHTGIFVAEAKGYFEQAGLDVEIIQPGEVYAEQAVVGGAADFGVSFQEQLTMARADGAELVSIAAIIQHNTSGFASRAGLGVETPADWEGLRYGSYGSPFERPTLSVLMQCAEGDFDQLEIVDTGFADPLALLDEQQTDLAWIFYAWQGVQAQIAGIDLDVVMMEDWFDCIPDYYTPIFITGQQTIDERPEVVAAFLEAISRGYGDAIENPEEAADILLEAVPEMSQELVRTSQAWLSPRYQADAPRWGEQSLSVWQDYADWMFAHGIISEQIDASQAFTNQFLPAR